MKVRTAIRKTVKWGGGMAVVLLVTLWVSGKWWRVQLTPSGTTQITSTHGRLIIEVRTANSRERWQVGLTAQAQFSPVAFSWDFWTLADSQSTGHFIPLWFPTLLVLIPTTLAWWPDVRTARRARLGLCRACGYDRRGIANAAVCPECGAASLVTTLPGASPVPPGPP